MQGTLFLIGLIMGDTQLRVYYEDTDAGGIVYHASYLRFAERARTEMLREAGFNHAQLLQDEGVLFAVISMEIKFKAPAKLDDLLIVTSRVVSISGASMTLEQEIMRDGHVLVEIKLTLACLDRRGKAVRLPEALRALYRS